MKKSTIQLIFFIFTFLTSVVYLPTGNCGSWTSPYIISPKSQFGAPWDIIEFGVDVNVTDSDYKISNVTLFYSTDKNEPRTYLEAIMNLTSGDEWAGTWSYQIDPLENGTEIYYYAKITDESGENINQNYSENPGIYLIRVYEPEFRISFFSIEDIDDFILKQPNLEALVSCLKRRDLLSDPDQKLNSKQYFKKFCKTEFDLSSAGLYSGIKDPKLINNTFKAMTQGALFTVHNQLFNCRTDVMKAEPITDSKLHWKWLSWVFKHDSNAYAEKLGSKPGDIGTPQRMVSTHALVSNVLMHNDFRWLGNVPIKDVIRLREKGELNEIRNTFCNNIKTLGGAEFEDLNDVIEEVRENWKIAVRKHKYELKKLIFNTGLSAGAVIAGTLGITVPIFGSLAWTSIVLSSMKLGGDLAKLKIHRKRPVAILLKANEGKS